MKIALLSDIHANLPALEACLAHAAAAGAQQHAFLGDLVGYGAQPLPVVQRVMALTRAGALAVQGNHDAYTCEPEPEPAERNVGHLSVAWTRAQLGPEELAFLAGLPLSLRQERVLLVHASADAPAAWHYVDSAPMAALSLQGAATPPVGSEAVRYVFSGHVHQQALYFRGADGRPLAFSPTPGVPIPVPRHRHWLATVGSVGQPRDGRSDAMYALFDDAAQQLTFHRVRYDVHAAAEAIRQTPLPPFFANRLEAGR